MIKQKTAEFAVASMILLTASILSACQDSGVTEKRASDSEVAIQTPDDISEKQKLDQLFKDYGEESLKLYPITATFQSRREFNDKFRLFFDLIKFGDQLESI